MKVDKFQVSTTHPRGSRVKVDKFQVSTTHSWGRHGLRVFGGHRLDNAKLHLPCNSQLAG